MPNHYVHETQKHILGLHARMLLAEDLAKAMRAKRPPVTLESMLAAGQAFIDQVDEPRDDPWPRRAQQVLSVLRHLDDLESPRLRNFFEDEGVRREAFHLLRMPPTQLTKERFETDSQRIEYVGAALWYARRSFEWTYERSTEGLLRPGAGAREHTVNAARLACRYELRDGFEPMAMLPRFDHILNALQGEDRAAYERWSVDYVARSGVGLDW